MWSPLRRGEYAHLKNDFRSLENQVAHRVRQGIAIQNARLLADTQNRLAQLAALQETNRAVVSTLDLNSLLKLIIQQATDLLQAESGMLNLVDWEKGEDEVVACAGAADRALGMKVPLDRSSPGGFLCITNQKFATPSSTIRALYQRGAPGVFQKQIKNAALAPLTIKDHVIGTLVVAYKLEVRLILNNRT